MKCKEAGLLNHLCAIIIIGYIMNDHPDPLVKKKLMLDCFVIILHTTHVCPTSVL